jgi:hypothetical protein
MWSLPKPLVSNFILLQRLQKKFQFFSPIFVSCPFRKCFTVFRRKVGLSVVGYQPFINPTHGLATQILTTGLFISVDNPIGK